MYIRVSKDSVHNYLMNIIFSGPTIVFFTDCSVASPLCVGQLVKWKEEHDSLFTLWTLNLVP